MTTSLGSDGWEHCEMYHWMVGQASQGVATMVMPDIPAAFQLPVSPLSQMLIPQKDLRAYAFVGFAVGAHELAANRFAA